MKKKAADYYPPLRLVRQMTEKYPNVWYNMEELFHKSNGQNGLPEWPDWCYAPMSCAIAITSGGRPLPQTGSHRHTTEEIRDAQLISALAPWRAKKNVFVFDPNFLELLLTQNETMKEDEPIPAEVLLHQPCQSYFIEFPETPSDLRGFLVHLEYDINNGERELRVMPVSKDGRRGTDWFYHIGSGSIQANISTSSSVIKQNSGELEYLKNNEKWQNGLQWIADRLMDVMPMILYLCANNADIQPSSEQAFYTRESSIIRDKYSEIHKWDVGKHIGDAIRSAIDEDEVAAKRGTHAAPRPHIRRAHWHNYWVGPMSEPSKRRLELRWIAPTFIAAYLSKEEKAEILSFEKIRSSKNTRQPEKSES